MQFLFIGAASLSILTLLFVIARYGLRWRRSYTLTWPANTGLREQAHICRAYLARSGIHCDGLMVNARTFDLVYRTAHNRIHIAFASPLRPVTESVLNDLSSAVSLEAKKIPIMIVHPKLATQEAIHLARDTKIPLLRPSEIPALRDLIKVGRPIKRQTLLLISYNSFNSPNQQPMEHQLGSQ